MPDIYGTMKNRWPSDYEEPYWPASQLLRDDIDKRMRANYEDKDLLIVGGAPFSLVGSTFTWGADLYIVSARGGKALRVPAGNIAIADGAFLYVAAPSRFITADADVVMAVSGVALDLDVDKIFVGVRRGIEVHVTGRSEGGSKDRELHDLTHSPLGLWQFEGDLLDSSGNAKHLSPIGTPLYGRGFIDPYSMAWYYTMVDSGGSRVDAAFALKNAMTFMVLIRPISQPGQELLGCYVGSGGSAGNALWYFSLDNDRTLVYAHQHGNQIYDMVTSEYIVNPFEWCHVGFTRAADGLTIKIFVNGRKIKGDVLGNVPFDGANSNLYIHGHISSYYFRGGMQSATVIDSELSEAQMLVEAKRCFGD